MPYRRRRTPLKRKRRYNKRRTGMTRRVGNYGRYGIAGELKFHDLDVDASPTLLIGAVTDSINLIAQSTTESTRIGRKVTIKSIAWDYDITLPATVQVAVPAKNDIVRVILFCDKQCNGATATVTDVLQTEDFHAFYNLVNKGRFKILMDKRHVINHESLASNATDLFSQAQTGKHFNRTFRMNTPIEFNNAFSDGRIITIRSNNFGVLIISDEGIAHFHSKFRVRFSDN